MAWRKYGIWVAVAVFLCAGAAMLVGCAAEEEFNFRKSGLTADSLREDGLAVLGVTVVDEVEQVRPPLVEALERELQYRRPDLAVLNAARVRDQLGVATYRRILSGYQQNASFTEADRTDLAVGLRNGARYLILARVEEDAIHVGGRGSLHLSNRTGSFGSVGVGFRSRTTRVRVMLYDVRAGRDIQSAVYESSSENAIPNSIGDVRRAPVLPRRIDSETPREAPPSDVPALVDAVVEAFRAFANDLPPDDQ